MRFIFFLLSMICWPIQAQERLFAFGESQHECYGGRIFIDPRQPNFFLSYLDGAMSGWDAARGVEAISKKPRDQTFDVAFLPDRVHIFLADTGGLSLVNLWEWRGVASFSHRDKTYYAVGVRGDSRLAAATAVLDHARVPNFTPLSFGVPHSSYQIHTEYQQEITLFDLEEQKILGSLRFEDSFVRSVQFSQNAKFLVTTSFLHIKFWDVSDPFHIKLEKEIRSSDLISPAVFDGVPVRPDPVPREMILSTATTSDLRLTAVATPYEIFVLDNNAGLVYPSLKWRQEAGLSAVSYLSWSARDQVLLGSTLQGQVFEWRLTGENPVVLATFNNRRPTISLAPLIVEPYAAFAIDPHGRYFVRPAAESSDWQCSGFEVIRFSER